MLYGKDKPDQEEKVFGATAYMCHNMTDTKIDTITA